MAVLCCCVELRGPYVPMVFSSDLMFLAFPGEHDSVVTCCLILPLFQERRLYSGRNAH